MNGKNDEAGKWPKWKNKIQFYSTICWVQNANTVSTNLVHAISHATNVRNSNFELYLQRAPFLALFHCLHEFYNAICELLHLTCTRLILTQRNIVTTKLSSEHFTFFCLFLALSLSLSLTLSFFFGLPTMRLTVTYAGLGSLVFGR